MKNHLSLLAVAVLVLTTPLSMQANNIHPLHDKIRFYEYSVTQSSVSPTLSETRKTEKLELLEGARHQVDLGHYRTAEGILKKIANNLYDMSPNGNLQKQSITSINATLGAIESILPQAHRIAQEKHAGQKNLNQVMQDYERAKAALESNDIVTADNMAQNSYRMLKEIVAELRSGDRLLIELPATDSREGWMDAAHRYIDWRYFNSQLLSAMQENGINTNGIDQARLDADQVYELATNIALQGDWQQAVTMVDQAYNILAKAWQNAGVDIGS